MFNKEELLAKVNQILDTDMTYKSYEETIELLVKKVEQQQSEIDYYQAQIDRVRKTTRFTEYQKLEKELKEAQCRELSYIDDIEQMEGMLRQANLENKLLQEKLINCKRKTTYAVYEENLRLSEELALIKGEMSG
jgi:predicted  nucleic acid-binding Zn-ribbon protein